MSIIAKLNTTFETARALHDSDYDAIMSAALVYGCTLAAEDSTDTALVIDRATGEAVARAWWGGHPSDRGFDDQTDI